MRAPAWRYWRTACSRQGMSPSSSVISKTMRRGSMRWRSSWHRLGSAWPGLRQLIQRGEMFRLRNQSAGAWRSWSRACSRTWRSSRSRSAWSLSGSANSAPAECSWPSASRRRASASTPAIRPVAVSTKGWNTAKGWPANTSGSSSARRGGGRLSSKNAARFAHAPCWSMVVRGRAAPRRSPAQPRGDGGLCWSRQGQGRVRPASPAALACTLLQQCCLWLVRYGMALAWLSGVCVCACPLADLARRSTGRCHTRPSH
ncbi:hypothetical protein OF001_U140121 [Pseudomonas sp. OF001]|nr:hypothetical protein OF001_U140121 [Pseudomonas sp. OF001]